MARVVKKIQASAWSFFFAVRPCGPRRKKVQRVNAIMRWS
jgi:hypothetical protein